MSSLRSASIDKYVHRANVIPTRRIISQKSDRMASTSLSTSPSTGVHMATVSPDTDAAPEQVAISDTDVYNAIQNISGARGVTLEEMRRYFKNTGTESLKKMRAKDLKAVVLKATDRCLENSILVKYSQRFLLRQVAVNMVKEKKACCSKKKKSDCRRCHQQRRVLPPRTKCPIKKRIMLRKKNYTTHRMVRRKEGGKKSKKSRCASKS